MQKLYNWINNNKNKENVLIQFITLVYSVEISTIPHVIFSTLLGIFVPIVWEQSVKWAIALLVLLVLETIFFCLCEKYHKKAFDERKFAEGVLLDHSSLLNSISIMISNSNTWKNDIFKTTCEMVCERIHEEFKNVFHCDVRVSIEYTFEKEFDKVVHLCRKMAGRCSNERHQGRKATKLSTRTQYYSYKIFYENKIGIHYLKPKDEDKEHWYKNPKHDVDVLQYIALANSFNETDVSFILQIDFLDEMKFGKENTDRDMKKFVNTYLKPYVNIVSIAYLLGRNKKGKIGDV